MSEKNKAPARRGPMMGGPMAGMMPGDKAKDFKGSVVKLAGYLGKFKTAVVFVWILATCSTIFTIVGPKILAKATDEIFQGFIRMMAGIGGIDLTIIGRIVIQMLVIYLIASLFSYLQGFVMSGVTMKIAYRLRNDINDKIHKLPFKYFDKTSHGEVLSRITNDVDTISQTLNQSLTQIITSVTSIIGITIMMLSISWQLTLVVMCILPLSMLFIVILVKKSQKHFANQQKSLGEVNGHIEEMFGSHIVIKAFNGEKDSLKTFDKHNNSLYESAWKANFLSGLMMPITNFIGNLSYVAVCILGGYFATSGRMTVGDIQAFIQYVRSFTQPIAQVANISNVLQQTAAAAERVFEFLGEEEEVPEGADALSINHSDKPDTSTCVHINGNIKFEHVSFGYGSDKIIIRDFNADIKQGQKIAIVGPTGAGKTTIVKLLMRFYDVSGGRITIDGHDIRDFKRNELRSMLGMVLQDTWLYNGTIMDNIRYGRLEAADEQVFKAAEAAQVDHFVRTLPDGYNLVLNEEADNISQGQKQLLTIARVILADPDILILDEATSNVDTRTEVMIQKAMNNLTKGRTSFIIAHRLSTIRNADLILVMNEGDIVELGTHENLMMQNGFYSKLYNSQFDTAG